MGRFFKKSKNIEAISQDEIHEFLRKENLWGKIQPDRVEDFYNALSRIKTGEGVEREDNVDYDYFGCKNDGDRATIKDLIKKESRFMNGISKEHLTDSRMLKAATALSYKFEKDMYAGNGEREPGDEFLKNLFAYSEDPDIEDKPATFGEMLDIDVKFMRYIALLSKKKAFAKCKGKLEKNPSGRITKYTSMENFEEVFSSDLFQIAMPNFGRKFATKDLYVRQRYENVQKAQNLVILVDNSGSMCDDKKKAMLKAALTLKLQDANDVHNVYVGTFEREIFGFKKIEKGMKFEELNFITLDRGTTDVNGCIKNTISQIKARSLEGFTEKYNLSDDHFEILIVNDGQDHVDSRYHPSIKTHALCLMQNNGSLKNICHRSGGTYFYLKGDE